MSEEKSKYDRQKKYRKANLEKYAKYARDRYRKTHPPKQSKKCPLCNGTGKVPNTEGNLDGS